MNCRPALCLSLLAVAALAGGCVDGDLTQRYDGTMSAADRGPRANALAPSLSRAAATRAYNQVAEDDLADVVQTSADQKRSEDRDKFLKDLDGTTP